MFYPVAAQATLPDPGCKSTQGCTCNRDPTARRRRLKSPAFLRCPTHESRLTNLDFRALGVPSKCTEPRTKLILLKSIR